MRIFNQNNNLSFTSIPIHYINVRSVKNNALIPVVFSKLNQKDPLDQKAIKSISSFWTKSINFNFPSKIMETFLNKTNLFCKNFLAESLNNQFFYAVEIPKEPINSKPLAQRIIGLISVRENPTENRISLSTLTTNPEFIKQNDKRNFKGIGEVMIGELINFAQKKGCNSATITSYNDGFYLKTFENAGIEVNEGIRDGNLFTIPQKYFSKYLEYINKKYNFN